MGFVQYSPWNDAASYGQGLGETLGNILLKLPLLRERAAQDAEDRAIRSRHAQAEEKYMGAHGDYFSALSRELPQRTENQAQANENRASYNDALLGLRGREISRKEAADQMRNDLGTLRLRAMEKNYGSQDFLRRSTAAMQDMKTSLAPDQFAQLIEHQAVQDELTKTKTFYTPFGMEIGRMNANVGATREGLPAMPAFPMERPQTPTQAPQVPISTNLFQPQGQINTPPLPITASRNMPPTREHNLMVVDKTTGQEFWATPGALLRNKNLQLLGPGQ